MKLMKHLPLAMMLMALTLFVAGCNNNETTAPPADGHDDSHSDAEEHAGHDHPTHGPHNGDLIELGGEEYHAELVHNDDDAIDIYILGSDAKTAVPIEAAEVVINAMHDGNPEQFKLAASADEGDPEGKSSRFTSSDAELVEHVHDEDAQPKLRVRIEGKQFTGKIGHDHDDDHGHSHE